MPFGNSPHEPLSLVYTDLRRCEPLNVGSLALGVGCFWGLKKRFPRFAIARDHPSAASPAPLLKKMEFPPLPSSGNSD